MTAPRKLESIHTETWSLDGASDEIWGEYLIVHDAGGAFELVKRTPAAGTISIRLTRGEALGLHDLLARFLGLVPVHVQEVAR